MTVATATMLLGGLVGCGTDNQATDMNANFNRTGIQSHDMYTTGVDDQNQGEGPLTDMMTPDRNGQGVAGNRGHNGDTYGTGTGNHGITGQNGQRGTFGVNGTGAQTGTQTGQMRNNDDHAGIGGTQGRGQAHRGITDDDRGIFDTQGTDRPGMGRAGLNGTTRDVDVDIDTEHSGITGGNRPGMVDEDGYLRGRARNGVDTADNNGNRRQGTGAMNMNPRMTRQGPVLENSETRSSVLGENNTYETLKNRAAEVANRDQ